MSKVSQYLQEHLTGEVSVAKDARLHFAHDASALQLIPAMIVYAANEDDIRKTARFCWQLAERGRPVPITARGGGTDTSGAAIGNGIMLVTTAYLNRVLALDPKKQFVTIEPGITYDKLQQTLYTHGLFLPVYPGSGAYATVGGGIANNAVGEKSVKYGTTGQYVQSLRVVLANGEVIETGPISKRELNRKMGLSTFEGHVYRELDKLLEENAQVISSYAGSVRAAHHNAGYNLAAVKTKDHFDLTPLFVGAQGTLGIISEATLKLASYNPATTLAMVSLNTLSSLVQVTPAILKLKPSMFDMVNKEALQLVQKTNPAQLGNTTELTTAVHLFIEFDDHGGTAKKHARSLQSLIEAHGGYCRLAETPEEQQELYKIRHSVVTILTQTYNGRRAVPVAEDVCLPVDGVVDYMDVAEKLFKQMGLPAALWGPIGSGVVRCYPLLDLEQMADRQKLFKISESLYSAALGMGGSISAGAGDGRMRSPYLAAALGADMYRVMLATKKIFDPHNILNAGVKTTSSEQLKTMLRTEYSQGHRHEHLPRN